MSGAGIIRLVIVKLSQIALSRSGGADSGKIVSLSKKFFGGAPGERGRPKKLNLFIFKYLRLAELKFFTYFS